MTKSNAQMLGSVIKLNRLSQNMSQKALAEGICVSSYLSRIEKGEIIPSEEVINDLFKALDMTYYDDPEFLVQQEALMRTFLEELNFNAFDQSRAIYQEIESQAQKLMSSPLIIDYYVIKLAYYCTTRDDETFNQTYALLSEMETLMTNHQRFHLHLYYGIDRAKVTADAEEAFFSLYHAKDFGESGHLYFWLGCCYFKLDNHLKAIAQFEKALRFYVDEGNLISIAGAYEMMGLTYYKDKHYFDGFSFFEKGIKFLDKAGRKEHVKVFNHHLAWGYIQLKRYEEALHYVSDLEIVSDEVMKGSWLKAFIGFLGKDKVIETEGVNQFDLTDPIDQKLKVFFSEVRKESKYGLYVDNEAILIDLYTATTLYNVELHRFFKSILLRYYQDKRRYKEAFQLLDK